MGAHVRRLRVVLGFLVLSGLLPVALSPAVTLAGTEGPTCLSTDTTKVRMWENADGDTSDDNDSIWFCGSDSDLSNNNHTLPGDCNRPWPAATTWNDCISSYTIWVPTGQHFCIYRDASYATTVQDKSGPISGLRFDASGLWSDTASSFRWLPSATPC